jgi:hypothetical protein
LSALLASIYAGMASLQLVAQVFSRRLHARDGGEMLGFLYLF